MEQTPPIPGTPATLRRNPGAAARHVPGVWWGGWCCAGVLLGTALQLAQPCLWGAGAYTGLATLALLALCVVWRRLRQHRAVPRVGVALAVAMLVFALTGLRAWHYQAQALDPALEGRDLRLVGTVAAMPQPMDNGVRLRVAVESATLPGPQGHAVPVPALVDVGWYRSGSADGADAAARSRYAALPQAGERWALTVRLKAPHGTRNPQGFDYELWLWEQGVGATGTVRMGARAAAPERLAQTPWYPVEQLRQRVRDAIFAALAPDAQDATRQRLAGVVAALVVGDQRAIERNDWDLFRSTGVSHLMSISGLHITMFAWLAAAAVGALWRRSARLCLAWPAPSAGLVGGLLLAGSYALFSGWGVPAQRTVAMLATVVLLRLTGRRWPWPQVWLLACAMAVVLDPWAMLQPGFWLSFVAVAALFASSLVASGVQPRGMAKHVAALLREQAVVTLALTPLGVLFFGQISLVGLVANLLAIPWVTLVLTPLALAGVLLAPLWHAALWAVQVLIAVLQWLSAWPWASLWLPVAPWAMGVVAVLGGLWLVLRLPWSVRLLGVPLVLPVLLWQYPRPAPGEFDLLAADVGQGTAVWVRTATHGLLYDAGPRYGLQADSANAGERVLVPLLRVRGERLDGVVLSHQDSDHTGGAAAVLAQQPQAWLMGSIAGDAALQALRAHQPCKAGQGWEWNGVRFEVLHPLDGEPNAAPRSKRGSPTNAQSCVLRVQSASGATALLTGDIEAVQEAQLVQRQARLQADVLLLPHHGSKTSSSAAFLDAVQPHTALVQTGYRNRYGHPAPVVLERLQARGVEVVDTAHCGAALWSSQPGEHLRCEREERPRYWQHGARPVGVGEVDGVE